MTQEITGAEPGKDKGLELSLIPENESYNRGEMPVFNAVLKNTSTNPITVCLYMAEHRLLSNMMAGDFEVLVFVPTPTPPLKNADFKTLKPGESISYRIDIKNTPGYGFVYAGSLPPVVPEDMSLKGFAEGTYKFQVHLGSHISCFSAPKGTNNHLKKRVHILSEVPGENLTIPLSQAWDGELVAKVPVTFK